MKSLLKVKGFHFKKSAFQRSIVPLYRELGSYRAKNQSINIYIYINSNTIEWIYKFKFTSWKKNM